MRLGSNFIFFTIIFCAFINFKTFGEDKITSTPLINLNEIKPSFEESDNKSEKDFSSKELKNKKIKKNNIDLSHAILIGLDKITAKSTKIKVKFDEIKKFGPLEIKVLRCEKVKVNNKFDDVAYIQVKDVSKNEDDKVFIFNGWTFASDPSLTPFDHAIYDIQLSNCFTT